MSDFNNLRTQLHKGRLRLSELDKACRKLQGQLVLLNRKIVTQNRRNNQKELSADDPLRTEHNRLSKALNDHQAQQEDFQHNLHSLEKDFHALGDPQQLTQSLDDHFPFLLLPLQLQTRFVQVQHITKGFNRQSILDISNIPGVDQVSKVHKPKGAQVSPFRLTTLQDLSKGNQEERKIHKELRNRIRSGQINFTAREWLSKVNETQELWIRVYPDEIFTHTFEKTLADEELRAGKNYWLEVWAFERSFQNMPPESATEENRHQGYLGPWRVLERSYGAARAGWIHKLTRPENYPASNNDWSEDPKFPDVEIKEDFWTSPPRSYMMPDRFVARLYSGDTFREVVGEPIIYPLALGLDPQSDSEEDFTPEGNKIRMPDNIHWLTDFTEAEKVGMAIRVSLSPAEYDNGFDQLIVLGLRLSSDEESSQQLVDQMLENHTYKPEGMSFLPKGTPTNNYRQHKSGYQSRDEDAESSMRAFTGSPLYEVFNEHEKKSDAQHLAEALGLDPERFNHIEKAEQQDVSEAASMNKLLWPASWGYYLQQFIQPKISLDDIEKTRKFFIKYVSGGGLLPSLRIHRQPYGFLATTAYSKWQYSGNKEEAFIAVLHEKVLHPIFNHWKDLTSHVNHLGDLTNPTTLSEEFVKLLSLQASSQAFRQRNLLGNSLISAALQLSFQNISHLNRNSINQSQLVTALHKIGLRIDSTSTLIGNMFQKNTRFLNGPAIESIPVSEIHPLRLVKELDFNRLEWLHNSSWQAILEESLFKEENIAKPKDLLYLLTRHAMLREYLQTGISILFGDDYVGQLHLVDFDFDYLAKGNNITPAQKQFCRKLLQRDIGPSLEKEAARVAAERRITHPFSRIIFIHNFINTRLTEEINTISTNYKRPKNKWQHLKQKISGQEVGDLIEEGLANPEGSDNNLTKLLAMKSALSELMTLPTARLERLFSEHLDLCHFRQDAWMLGLVNQRLLKNRNNHPRGIYLGAYGYLEQLRVGSTPGLFIQEMKDPVVKRPTSVNQMSKFVIPVLALESFSNEEADISDWLAHAYVDLADNTKSNFDIDPTTQKIIPPPRTSTDSEGFLLTPSIDHAKAAAVLRAGYAAHQKTTNQNTQEAAEAFAVNLSSDRVRSALHYLNGVQNGQPLNVLLGYRFERSMYDHHSTLVLSQYVLDIRNKFPLIADKLTEDPANESILLKESSNVLDGLALLDGFRKKNWQQGLNIPNNAIKEINKILQELDNSLDAVNDLQMAESVFQMVRGNSDRAAAALRVLNSGGAFQFPEIIQPPQQGHLLTQRFGVCFPGNDEIGSWGPGVSPRSLTAPGLNRWLGQQLPPPEKLFILARTKAGEKLSCPFSELDIQPIDLVYQLKNSIDIQPMTELAQSVQQWARKNHGLRESPVIEVQAEGELNDDQYSLYELLPLIRNLWSLLENSRPLLANDLQPATEARSNGQLSGEGIDASDLASRMERLIRGEGEQNFVQAVSNLKEKFIQLEATDISESTEAELEDKYNDLFDALLVCASFGIEKAVPDQAAFFTEANPIELKEQARRLIQDAELLEEQLFHLLDQVGEATTEEQKTNHLLELAHRLFGEAFLVSPDFRLSNEVELSSALSYPDFLKDGGPFAFEEWLQGVAQVRPPIHAYQSIQQLREALGLAEEHKAPEVAQLPFHPGKENRWLGLEFPVGYELDSDTLSLLLDLPPDYKSEALHSGLLLDQWKEVIPEREVEAGIALHQNQPNTEAPQMVLLAVSPQERGKWEWDDLMDTVRDTMALAKMRLVTPEIIEEHSPLSHLLPAVIPAVIDTEKGPTLDLSRNMKTPLTVPPFSTNVVLPTTGTILINR